MKGRAVRIKVTTFMAATLADRVCEVIDISVTGALLVVDLELPVGSQQVLKLGDVTQMLELSTRVVRLRPASERGRWQTAVVFEGASPKRQREISVHVSRLLAAPRRRSLSPPGRQ